jgi:hypothetical protein
MSVQFLRHMIIVVNNYYFHEHDYLLGLYNGDAV